MASQRPEWCPSRLELLDAADEWSLFEAAVLATMWGAAITAHVAPGGRQPWKSSSRRRRTSGGPGGEAAAASGEAYSAWKWLRVPGETSTSRTPLSGVANPARAALAAVVDLLGG